MNSVVVVTGVPGVGKSTVISRALEKLESQGTRVRLVNYGDIMFDLFKREGVTDRDDMRKMPLTKYRKIQRDAAERISKMAKQELVLVDTHCSIKKPEGYFPGLPKWVLEKLDPAKIVVIEAKPEEVTMRRNKDVSRRRDEEILMHMAEHQQLNRAIAMAYAALTGATVTIIQNRQGKIDEAVNEMVAALR